MKFLYRSNARFLINCVFIIKYRKKRERRKKKNVCGTRKATKNKYRTLALSLNVNQYVN